MPVKPRVLKREIVCQSRLFKVEQLELKFSNGEERTYERLLSGNMPAVIIVPMINENTVLMIREYGAGIDGYELALPKGRVERGEDILDAANRELMEEVGYGAKKLKLIKCMTQSPGYMQHKTQIVLAQDLYPKRLLGDEPEQLDVIEMNIDDILKIIFQQDLTEARSIASLFIVKEIIRNDKLHDKN